MAKTSGPTLWSSLSLRLYKLIFRYEVRTTKFCKYLTTLIGSIIISRPVSLRLTWTGQIHSLSCSTKYLGKIKATLMCFKMCCNPLYLSYWMGTTRLASLTEWLALGRRIRCSARCISPIKKCQRLTSSSSSKDLGFATLRFKTCFTRCTKGRMIGHTTSLSVFSRYTTSRWETCSQISKMQTLPGNLKEMTLTSNNISLRYWKIMLGAPKICKWIRQLSIITQKDDQPLRYRLKLLKIRWKELLFKIFRR